MWAYFSPSICEFGAAARTTGSLIFAFTYHMIFVIISDLISNLDLYDCFINGLNLSLSFQRFRNDRLSIQNYLSTFMYRHHCESLLIREFNENFEILVKGIWKYHLIRV